MQDLTSWTYPYTKKVYDVLLRFVVHVKPRVNTYFYSYSWHSSTQD